MVTKIAATGYELEIVQRVVEATRTLYDLPDDVSDEMAHFSDRIQEMAVHHWPAWADGLVTADVDDDLPRDETITVRLTPAALRAAYLVAETAADDDEPGAGEFVDAVRDQAPRVIEGARDAARVAATAALETDSEREARTVAEGDAITERWYDEH